MSLEGRGSLVLSSVDATLDVFDSRSYLTHSEALTRKAAGGNQLFELMLPRYRFQFNTEGSPNSDGRP